MQSEALPLTLGLQFISHPMDLGTIKAKLRERRYADPREFAADMRLVWSNCRTYNQIGTTVRVWGDQLSDDFERKWAEYNCEQRWDDLMAARDPQVSRRRACQGWALGWA